MNNEQSPEVKKNYASRMVIILIPVILGAILCIISLYVFPVILAPSAEKPVETLAELPLPEVTGGARGELGIDKNINEETIDQYLGRSDSVYRDMRMLEDPGNYEAIGGDRYLSGFVEGFEVVSLPYLIPVSGLPEAVGDTYTGETLFGIDEEGNYYARYEESMQILEELFPKDKNIFLMCGGGGYAGMTKQLLVSLGWNGDKIWNTGGYWYYDGEHNVQVKQVDEQGNASYNFDLVKYHEIDFSKLTPKSILAEKFVPNSIKEPIRLNEKYYSHDSIAEYSKLRVVQSRDEDIVNEITARGETLDAYNDKIATQKAEYINAAIDRGESFFVAAHNYTGACGGGDTDEFSLENAIKSELFADCSSASGQYVCEGGVYGYEANLTTFKKTKLYDTVKYAPSIIVVKDGEIYAYIDNNVDNIKSYEEFKSWVETYIQL